MHVLILNLFEMKAIHPLTLSRSHEDILKVEIYKAAKAMLPFDSPLLPYLGQILTGYTAKPKQRLIIRASWASR